MRFDLHVHTRESDGYLSVQEIIELAKKEGINTLAITDHESTQGIVTAQLLAPASGLKIIPGVEFLTFYHDTEVHLLGYFRDVKNMVLQNRLKELRIERTALTLKMIKKANQSGFPLEWKDVEKEATAGVAISLGHIIRTFIKKEKLMDRETLRKIISLFKPGGIAYLPFSKHPFQEAVDLIFASGGLPVLAHPGLLPEIRMVEELLAYRQIGLEVYYGYWENRDNLIAYYADLASKSAVLATGGSDYHSPFGRIKLGHIDIPSSSIYDLQAYLGIKE
ncbi:MAG: PHP domain-containing protein [Desulfitobacteriaceae bacterium]|nr:PHP domain-containing protein [Desulfitobacteriaceae bacterium]MDD4347197.1 PHP domain-containing protein [Desulfitobacteriaceae bacterium]MDD4401708.1 PHP domain-containing protein [Desulfitobacteriaceae bacterium]